MKFLQLIILFHVILKIYCDPVLLINSNIKNHNPNTQINNHNRNNADDLEEQQRQRNYDISQIKLSKLRMLLLGELLKQRENIITYKIATAQAQAQAQAQAPLLNCTVTSQTLNVTTKTCPCTNYLCKRPLVIPTSSNNNYNYINQRRSIQIQTTCHDFCCKRRKSIKSIISRNENSGNQTVCDKSENILSKLWIVTIVNKQTDDVVCTGNVLSSRVILTTGDCVEKLSTTDLALKNHRNEELTISKTVRDDRYHLGFVFVTEQKWSPVCLQDVNSNKLSDCRILNYDNHTIAEIKLTELAANAACESGYQRVYFGETNICINAENLKRITSGSPLICRTFDSYVSNTLGFALKGLFYSWSAEQDKIENLYNSYMDIYQHRNWIYKHL